MTFPECIILQGGGALTMSYLNPLRLIETEAMRRSQKVVDLCKEFRGVSAGAMAAVFMTLGLSTYKIEQLCRDIFDQVLGDTIFDLETFLTQRGGKCSSIFVNIINSVIVDVLGKDFTDTTFKELHEKTGVFLRVYAAEINCADPGTRELSHVTEPDMPVSLGVAASCAIPFIFTPVFFRGKWLVDGNTGIDTTFECTDGRPTIMLSASANVDSAISKMSFQGYVECIINLLLSTMRKVHSAQRAKIDKLCVVNVQTDLSAKAIMGGSRENIDKIIEAGAEPEICEQLIKFLGV